MTKHPTTVRELGWLALACGLLLGATAPAHAQQFRVEVNVETAGGPPPMDDDRGRRAYRWDVALQRQAPFEFSPGSFIGFQQNAGGFPQGRGGDLVLLDARHTMAGAAAFLVGDLAPPYAVEFDFRSEGRGRGRGRGRGARGTGDGVVLMIQRDPSVYGAPPTAGDRGFVADGSGYGVHFDPVADEVVLTDGRGRTLAVQPNAQVGDGWHNARVVVQPNRIQIFVDGQPAIRMHGAVDASFGALGFGAGNGRTSARQMIRNIRIAQPGAMPTPPPGPGPDADHIVNGSFEQPRLRRGTFQMFPSIEGWGLESGPGIEVQNGVAGRSSDGIQHVELDSGASSAIYQDVPTRPGRTFELSFDFAPRPGTAPRDNRVDVFWNGAHIGTVQGSGMGQTEPQWQTFTFQVQATGPTSRITFRDAGISNSVGSYLDNVRLVPVGPGPGRGRGRGRR